MKKRVSRIRSLRRKGDVWSRGWAGRWTWIAVTGKEPAPNYTVPVCLRALRPRGWTDYQRNAWWGVASRGGVVVAANLGRA
jgi:hypothetical protein